MVSKTLKACSSLSGLVCVGPVQTLACASSRVWFGFGNLELRYEVETDGFRISDSESPNWSIIAESSAAFTTKQAPLPIRYFEGNRREVWLGECVELRSLLVWNWDMDEKESSGLSRAFMAIYSLRSLSLSISICVSCFGEFDKGSETVGGNGFVRRMAGTCFVCCWLGAAECRPFF